MKKLMLGNEALARGLYEGGCSFVQNLYIFLVRFPLAQIMVTLLTKFLFENIAFVKKKKKHSHAVPVP